MLWVLVRDCRSGAAILDARFNFDWSNQNNGWYIVYVGDFQYLCAQAPGYGQVCGNTSNYQDIGDYMWFNICAAPPPPPPNCSCWS
jgi:hypothetical protein